MSRLMQNQPETKNSKTIFTAVIMLSILYNYVGKAVKHILEYLLSYFILDFA